MNPARKFKRGDLVRIRTFTAIDDMMQRKKLYFVGTVLECRYKVGAYCIYPANSPLTTEPYWIDAASLEPLPDTCYNLPTSVLGGEGGLKN